MFMMNLAHSRKNEKRSQICYITSLFRTTLHHNNIIIRKQNSHIKLVFSFINEKRVRFFGNKIIIRNCHPSQRTYPPLSCSGRLMYLVITSSILILLIYYKIKVSKFDFEFVRIEACRQIKGPGS